MSLHTYIPYIHTLYRLKLLCIFSISLACMKYLLCFNFCNFYSNLIHLETRRYLESFPSSSSRETILKYVRLVQRFASLPRECPPGLSIDPCPWNLRVPHENAINLQRERAPSSSVEHTWNSGGVGEEERQLHREARRSLRLFEISLRSMKRNTDALSPD